MKPLLILLFALISVVSIAQKKEQATPEQNPTYKKVVQLDSVDFKNCLLALNEWKRLAIYDPVAPAAAKVKITQDLELYILELQQKVKVDSIRTDTVNVIDPKKKR